MKTADPSALQHLSDEIVLLCGRIHHAEYRLLELIRQLDALHPWNEEMPSCAHWLNWRCGIDLVTGREKVRVAHALERLPKIRDGFREGRLSYSKVRALTRIAEWHNEAELVEMAMSTTAAHVEKLVRAQRQADRLAESGVAFNAYRNRSFHCHTLDDGSLVFEGRLPAEQGAMLLLALERGADWLFNGRRRENENENERRSGSGSGSRSGSGTANADDDENENKSWSENERPGEGSHARARRRNTDETAPEIAPLPIRRADALAAIAERFLSAPPAADEGLNTADRYQLTIHASAESLPEFGSVDRDDPPQVDDGPVLATETVRRLACDAAVVRILETGAGEPLDVGRKTRVIPPAIRRALNRRDRGCRFPGCPNTRFVDGHHIVHWADGGDTSLSNLVQLCRHHHRLIHEGGYYVVKDDDDFIFCRGDGLMIRPVNESLQKCFAHADRDLFINRIPGSLGISRLDDHLPAATRGARCRSP